jgi:PII-like signaling protein
MSGTILRFFVHEAERHGGELLFEWLLEEARRLGVPGGSAFRAIAGYGRHGVLHEQTFFELAGQLPVQVVFVTSTEHADRLLARLSEHGVRLFYALSEARFGVTGVAGGRVQGGRVQGEGDQ